MKQYTVTGMSCAACSARVEKAVLKVSGVTSCAVSLLTNSMGVEGAASPSDIIAAVEAAGYGAAEKTPERTESSPKKEENPADRETALLMRRFIASLAFLLPLMYFSMGAMMWGWPVPPFFEGNHIAEGILQLMLTTAVMFINGKFFVSGFKGVLHRAPNMDTLVAMGAGAAYIYSVYALFAMTDAQLHSGHMAAMALMDEFYFESAATILTLITLGKMLEARSKGKTTDALKGLIDLSPKTAIVLRDGEEREIPAAQVKKGDIFIVRPGAGIPVDGVVLEGSSAVNESALTGESVPADKIAGDYVSAATINQSGYLKCEALRVGEDTALSQIIRMVSDAAATKAPIAKAADRVSGVFVPVVIVIALITAAVWLIAGESAGFALARGISVLVISCPCALGLATPVAIMVGNGVGAKNGILFKTAASLEQTGRTSIVALDKTGTITKGEPTVTDVITAGGISEGELLTTALALEKKSEHPLARAVLKYCEEQGITSSEEAEEFTALRGSGLSALLGGQKHIAGNLRLAETYCDIPDDMRQNAERLSEQGKTPLFFCRSERLVGVIAVADVIKEDSPDAIRQLREMGIRVVMLTGDNQRTAEAIGRQAGVDEVIAGVLPDGKEEVIRRLSERGKVAMVGDGINDAPALTRADVGIAIGAGTDIAIDAAGVVLMKSRLSDVPAAIRLSRAALRNIHQNLFWAFFYNAVGIPLAAGVWIPIFGWTLNPMFGAAAMSLSSFCVVSNALRLNFVNIYRHNAKKLPPAQASGESFDITTTMTKEETTMEVTMKIEGMMCGHCEATVKKALEALPTVEKAEVSHTAGTAVVTLSADTPFETLKKAVEDQEYTVVG